MLFLCGVFFLFYHYCDQTLLTRHLNLVDELRDRIKAVEFTASTHSIDFVKTDKMKVWVREVRKQFVIMVELIIYYTVS